MALSGELSFNPSFVNSGRAQEYAKQMRDSSAVNNMYAMSRKETKKKNHKRAINTAIAIAASIGLFFAMGAAMKASQQAGYVSDSHGNVSYAGMRVYEEPGSGISRGGSGD